MPPDKLRVASVGLGGWGGTLAEGAGRSGALEIVRCFDASEEARAAFSEKTGCRPASTLDEVLRDAEVEGVLIATPHSTHADIVCAAASAGKHIFIEKPFTLTVRDARRCIDAAEGAGRVLQVGHKRRWFGANRRIREMIAAGELGMVHQMEANYSRPSMQTPRAGWRGDPAESPLGGMTGMGIHMVDLLHSFAGPVKRLAAFSKPLLGKSGLDDVTNIVFEFESGPLGYVGTSTVVPIHADVAVFGTGAAAWSEEDGARLFFQGRDEPLRRELQNDLGDGIAGELAHFARCIRKGERPDAGGAEGLEIVAVLEAVMESVRSGQAVEVAPFRG
jgi:predicted dehydrogenase